MHVIIDATTTQDQMAYHGVGQYTKNICKHLVENFPNDKFTLLLFDGKSTLDDFLTSLKKSAQIQDQEHENLSENANEPEHTNLSVVRIGRPRPNNYLNLLWYELQILPGANYARRLYEDEKCVYFCPYFWRYFPVRGIPTVLMVHDMILPVFNMYSDKQGVFADMRKFQYWHALNRSKYCAKILTNSDYTRKDFLKFFPKFPKEDIKCVHLGIEKFDCKDAVAESGKKIVDGYLPRDWRERGYLIYMGGGITKNKNSFGVVHSYKKFLARWFNEAGSAKGDSVVSGSVNVNGSGKGENARSSSKGDVASSPIKMNAAKPPYLVIAGKVFENTDNPGVAELHEVVHVLGIHKNVVFPGFYKDGDKSYLLKNAFAFIHISTYEGFGTAVGEALSCGTPVIAHDGTSYPEVVGDAGILVDGKNYSKVGEKIFDLWSSSELRSDLGKKAVEQASKFDWNDTAKKTAELLREAASD